MFDYPIKVGVYPIIQSDWECIQLSDQSVSDYRIESFMIQISPGLVPEMRHWPDNSENRNEVQEKDEVDFKQRLAQPIGLLST